MKNKNRGIFFLSFFLLVGCGLENNPSPVPPSQNNPENVTPSKPNPRVEFSVGTISRSLNPQSTKVCLFDFTNREIVVNAEDQQQGASLSIRLGISDAARGDFRFYGSDVANKISLSYGIDRQSQLYQSRKMRGQPIESICSGQYFQKEGFLGVKFTCENLLNSQNRLDRATGEIQCATQTSSDWGWR